MVLPFACVTLTKAMKKALEVQNSYEKYHIAKGSGHTCRKGHRPMGQDHQGPQQRRRTDSVVIVYAREG